MTDETSSEARGPEDPSPSGAPRTIPAESIPVSRLDQDALRVISRLQRSGFEAYLVGGCVRDLLIGRIPKDFDVATDAHPRQIRRLFRNARIIGRRFRLAHITYGDHVVETATFRREPILSSTEETSQNGSADVEKEGTAESEKEASPESAFEDLLITQDNVFGTAEEDAQRRDFSINALFLDPTRQEILDYVGGLDDLEDGLLRTIGDPAVRMAEDPVRILRAVKFATRLSFRIEDGTWAAMKATAAQLARAAPPRVLEEILRLLRSGSALGAVRMLRACGALAVILPRVDAHLGEIEAAGDQGRAGGLWALLEALDSDVHAGFVPSTPLCLALLYLPIIERETERPSSPDARPQDLLATATRILEPVAVATRLARRDVARAIRVIDRQRRFTQPASRHFRPLLFVLGEEFPEALDLFRLRAAARGSGWDIYEGWRARRELALATPPDELEAERKLARKRRRRRRRRVAGDGSGSSPPASET
jgi:poly(A) polymerase